jgi:hypothetical protein
MGTKPGLLKRRIMKLKELSFLLMLLPALFIIQGCEEDDRDTDFLENIEAPSNISLEVTITQDNTGTVTFVPSGDNASSFILDFGDGSPDRPEIVSGESISHIYSEGNYSVNVIAKNLLGNTTDYTQDISVSFIAPQNLEVTVTPVAGDNFSRNISAEADFAIGFEVYFGDVTNEQPTPLMVGETITHTYPSVGSFELRVVALSGGTATTEVTQTIEIEDPLVLPIDFESPTIDYIFGDFGGATTMVIDNPDPSGINTSSKVAELFKETGAQDFAGTVIELGSPIDFSENDSFKIDVWSPDAGINVLLKIENADDPNIFEEVMVTNTVANQWEELVFDFSNGDLTQEYAKVVVFFDFGSPGTGTTYYFDNIEQTNLGGGGGGNVTLPLDFEDPNLNYVIVGFEGADSAIEPNPDPSGINTSDNVVRTTKTVGAQFFAGTLIELDEPIDFSGVERIAIKTWSPKANIPVRLKLETSDPNQFVELDVNTTVLDQWEELVWDFSGQTSGLEFIKVIVFFEFIDGLMGDGSTYYFDDIKLDD